MSGEVASSSWHGFALLVIDLQHDFWSTDVATTSPDLPARIGALIERSRREGLLVVHVRASFRPDGADWMARYRLRGSIPCIEGTEGAEVLPFARALPGETVVVKQTFDAFLGTELHEVLQGQGVRGILVAGLVTSTCVLFTAATATQLGYLVSVVGDCCSDDEASHGATLAGYRFVFDTVDSTEIDERLPLWREQIEQMAGSPQG